MQASCFKNEKKKKTQKIKKEISNLEKLNYGMLLKMIQKRLIK